jgi:hypothetical protein
MSASTPSSIRVAVRRLTDDIGESASGEQVASAAARLIETLCRRFAAVVGDSGIGAVLDRAVKDVGRDLGWHVAAAPSTPAAQVRRWDAQVEPIRDHLRRLEPPVARTALVALLDTFLTMVCTFIGETLTLRLLQELT